MKKKKKWKLMKFSNQPVRSYTSQIAFFRLPYLGSYFMLAN